MAAKLPGDYDPPKPQSQAQLASPLEQYGTRGIYRAIARAEEAKEPTDEFGQPLPTSIGHIHTTK